MVNGPIPGAGCQTTDDVVIRFTEAAAAGLDQYICGSRSVTLAGNTPTLGTGTWTLTGVNPGIITGWGATTANTPAANPTVSVYGTYTFRWTVVNGPIPGAGCQTTDDVVIRFSETAAAGLDQYICGTRSTVLAGNTPSAGTGTWTLTGVNPGTITGWGATTANTPAATPTVSVYGTYTFRWTIANGPIPGAGCQTTDDVVINFSEAAAAGLDKYVCGTRTTTLAGNTPTIGTGTWTLTGVNPGTITGWGATTANTPAATPTVSVYGTYTFRWTVVNGPIPGAGCQTTDDVVIAFSETAAAGLDQYICGTTVTTLAGNTPSAGTGTWTLTGVNPGTITGWGATTANTPAATPTVSVYGTYTFRWTIVNGPIPGAGCQTTDDVIIRFSEAASAGLDKYVCGTRTTTLAGNTPTIGTGTWTLTGVNPGTITGWGATTANTPAATPTVSVYGTYTFRWTVVNGPIPGAGCQTTDDVVISFSETAAAGLDQYICGTRSTVLAGNTPSAGTGTWTLTGVNPGIITGWGATTANTPAATPTVSVYGTYTFRWTVVNGPIPGAGCQTTDDVVIRFTEAAAAGLDQYICGSRSVTLAGNTPTLGTGTWTLTGVNPGIITGWGATTANTPAANPTVSVYGTYTFRWTVVNGPIPGAGCQTTDDVVIRFSEAAAAGPDQNICGSKSALMAGNTPSAGTGTWTLTGVNPGIITGWGATTANTPAATPTVSVYGAYTFRWTVVNGPIPGAGCQTTDDIIVNFAEQPTANPGAGGIVCGTFSFNLAALPYNYAIAPNQNWGTHTWSMTGSPAGATVTSWGAGAGSAATTVTIDKYGTYQFTWTETNGTCSDAKSVSVTFNEAPLLTIGLGQTICSSIAANRSLSITNGIPATTYQWGPPVNTGGMTGGTAGAAGSTGPITDVFVNKTGAVQTATYSVIPTSGAGCAGPARDVVITVNPEPLAPVITGLDKLCTTDVTIHPYMVTLNALSQSFQWTVRCSSRCNNI